MPSTIGQLLPTSIDLRSVPAPEQVPNHGSHRSMALSNARGSSRRALGAALPFLPIRSFRLATPAITRGHLCLHKIWIDNIVPGGPMPMRCTEGATYSWRPPPNRQRLAAHTRRRLYRYFFKDT